MEPEDLIDALDARVTLAEANIAKAVEDALAKNKGGSAVDGAGLAAQIAGRLSANQQTGDYDQLRQTVETVGREMRALIADQAKTQRRPMAAGGGKSMPLLVGLLLVLGLVFGAGYKAGGAGGADEWARWLWNAHGPEAKACYDQARSTGKPVPCPLTISP